MHQSLLLHLGRPRSFVAFLACVFLFVFGGCGGGSEGTAAFPKMEKASIVTERPKAPAKGMDRIGSDGIAPK
jgi:hypothetical protein